MATHITIPLKDIEEKIEKIHQESKQLIKDNLVYTERYNQLSYEYRFWEILKATAKRIEL